MFKVGEKVFSKVHGRGIVTKNWEKNIYSIAVKFERLGCILNFTENGNFTINSYSNNDINKVIMIKTRYNEVKYV